MAFVDLPHPDSKWSFAQSVGFIELTCGAFWLAVVLLCIRYLSRPRGSRAARTALLCRGLV